MKAISRMILISLLALSLAACQAPDTGIIKPGTPVASQASGDTTEDHEGSAEGGSLTTATDSSAIAQPQTTAADLPATSPQTTADETSPDQTAPEDPGQTTPGETQPETTASAETTPAETTPAESTPAETKPAETAADPENLIKSNIPPEFQSELSKEANALIIIYRPELFKEIKAITKWTIVEYDTNTQLFLVTKKKGSRVEVTDSQLTDGEEVVIPGDVIRDWATTSDFEVIRIVYTDPETMPFNFIRVIEPDGRKTTLPIHTSMRDNPDWEIFTYDEN